MAVERSLIRTKTVLQRILGITALIAAAGVLVMMALTTADVLRRFLLDKPITGVFEGSGLILAFVVFLSLAYAQSVGAHVKLEFIVARFPLKTQGIIRICVIVLLLALFAVVIWKTGDRAYVAWHDKEFRWGAIPLPTWPSKAMVPLGFSLLSVRFLVELLGEFSQLMKKGRA